jgi:hypothetical protein
MVVRLAVLTLMLMGCGLVAWSIGELAIEAVVTTRGL